MVDYYLIPHRWSIDKTLVTMAVPNHTDWIRLVKTSHQKKRLAAEEYQRELNDGELFSMLKVVNEGITMFDVIAIPYNQARDYNSFSQWKCNQ